jgi:hypothetical protein
VNILAVFVPDGDIPVAPTPHPVHRYSTVSASNFGIIITVRKAITNIFFFIIYLKFKQMLR